MDGLGSLCELSATRVFVHCFETCTGALQSFSSVVTDPSWHTSSFVFVTVLVGFVARFQLECLKFLWLCG